LTFTDSIHDPHLLSLVVLDHPYEPSTISGPGRAAELREIWRYKAKKGAPKISITKLTKLSGIIIWH
jgi:hypothetical protein